MGVVSQLVAQFSGTAIAGAIDRQVLKKSLSDSVSRAKDCFVKEHSKHDLELVEVLTAQIDLDVEPSLQTAIRHILTQPFHNSVDEVESIRQSFGDVLPSFKERERVDAAVRQFLKCLAGEVLYIPQLQPLYTLLLQQKNIESSGFIAANTFEIVSNLRALREDLQQLPENLRAIPLQLPGPRSPQIEHQRPLHNLPQRTYPEFVGRKAELDDLIRVMLPTPKSRYFLVTIDGVGGVGKSVLALELGYYYLHYHETLPPDERFDAIILMSAKHSVLTARGIQKRQQTFTDLGDLYREIATVMEKPKILQVDKEEQAGIVRHELTSQRVLLIVDNLETIDDQELLTFLQELPEPTKGVVTTRHRIDIAYPVRLLGMPNTDALNLIKLEAADKKVELTPDLAQELHRGTGGVPLGIVWSIGLMGLGYEPQSVLDRLRSGQSDIARFCFEEGFRLIQDRDSSLLLLALSLFDSSVNRSMVGEVAGVRGDLRRDDALTELQRLSFVSKGENRFSLLPLTRVFALEKLSAEHELEVSLRESWIRMLIDLASPYAEVNWRWHDLTELSVEGQHLITLAEWAKQANKPDILLRIIPALGFYYDITGQWTERLEVERMGVEYARLLGDNKLLFITLRDISGVLGQQGRYDEAAAVIRDALNLARETKNITWECKALISSSGIRRRQGQLDEAVKFCDQAMQAISELSDEQQQEIRASIEYELGKIARDRGNWHAAEAHFIAARDVFGYTTGSTKFDVGRAWGVLSNLAVISHKLGNLEAAAQVYLQCLDYCRRTGSKGSVATLLVRLAELEEQRGNYQIALESVREALAWSKQLGMIQERSQAEDMLKRLAPRVDSSEQEDHLPPGN